MINITLPSVDVYSDLGMIINFYTGSRRNHYCDKMVILHWDTTEEYYEQHKQLLECHYNDSLPTSNLTYTPHYSWGTMMILPFLLN